jgi:hypothetical protein
VEIDIATSEEGRNQPLYTLVAFLSADMNTEPEAGGAGQ